MQPARETAAARVAAPPAAPLTDRRGAPKLGRNPEDDVARSPVPLQPAPPRPTPDRATAGAGRRAGANPLATLPEADLRALFAAPADREGRIQEGAPRPGRGPSLNTAFRVFVDGAPVDVARIAGLALAADPGGLDAERDADGALVWRAPPLPLRLTLGRALGDDRYLYDWRRAALEGGDAVRRVTIHHLDRDADRALNGWELRGWPLAWTGPDFDANDGGLAWETLEIVAHDLIWLKEIPDGRLA